MTENFRRTELRTFELLNRSKDLVGSSYWLFVGITAVGLILGGLIPVLIIGALMCGIYMAYRAKSRNEEVEFGILFKGFEHFVQSLIATVIVTVITLVIMSPFIALYFMGIFAALEAGGDEAAVMVIGSMLSFYAVIGALSLVVGAAFIFVYPLIIDGKSGVEAIQLSVKAALANLWGVLRLMLLNGLLGLIGMMCCGIGIYFVMPLTLGMTWLAYRDVFPDLSAAAPPRDSDEPAFS